MNNRGYYESKRLEMYYFMPTSIKRSIEFGCGDGGFSNFIKMKYGSESWGVDMDQKSINFAKDKIDKAILGDAFEIIEELPDNYFDCLICNDFIEHIYSPEIFFEKIKRCLTRDAVLICSIPNVRYWNNVRRFIFLKDWKQKKSGILDYTHLRFFTKKSMKRSIKEWGFQIELMKGISPVKSPVFYIFNILTLNFIGDMRFLQYGFRARLKD